MERENREPQLNKEQNEYTFEDWKQEYAKLQAFVNKIEERININGFDVLRPGFWTELMKAEKDFAAEVAQPAEYEYVEGKTGEIKTRKAPFATFNDVAKREIVGGDAYLLSVFARDCFYFLRENKLLADEDKDLFLKAMPYYDRWHIRPELDTEVFSQLEDQRREVVKELFQHVDSKDINKLLAERSKKYLLIWNVGRGYEETKDPEVQQSSNELLEALGENILANNLAHSFSYAARNIGPLDPNKLD